jgi:phenylalanyl-tRNA synthetase beta chain
VRVFEAGRAFLRSAAVVDGDTSVAGVDQPMRLAGLAYGSADALQWGIKERAVDFFDLKGDVEALLAPREPRFVPDMHPAMHPGRCARVELDGRAIGHAGELHPKWRQAYELPMAPLLFELDVEALLQRVLPAYAAVQRHQSVWRDLSVIVGPQVTHEALKQAIASANSAGLVRSMRLFDVYRPSAPAGDLGSEERSLSVRLELLDDAVTLTEERIDAAVADVLTALMRRLGARLRS